MADLIRTYIVPLRKAWLKSPKYKRAPKAARTVEIFARKHMKAGDLAAVKLTPQLNNALWAHGIKNPPHKVHVDCKKDDKGVVIVQVHGMPFPVPREEKKEGLASKMMEKFTGKKAPVSKAAPVEAQVVKSETKESAEKKEAPKAPAKTEAKKEEPKPAAPAHKTEAPKHTPAEPEKKETPPLRLNTPKK
ncbi:MAG: hypothetical protein AABY13_03270 [Nanoarchaeota archaeon]